MKMTFRNIVLNIKKDTIPMFVSALHRVCTNEETFLMFIDMNTADCLLFIIIDLWLRPFHFSSFIAHRVV